MDYEMIEGITEAHNADADYYGAQDFQALEIRAEVELFEIMGV